MKKLRKTKLENLLTIDPRLGIILYDLEQMAAESGFEITLGTIKKYAVKAYLYESDIFTRTRIARRLNSIYGDLIAQGHVALVLNEAITLQVDPAPNRIGHTA